MRVLVIDDDRLVTKSLAMLLNDSAIGYEIAHGGETGIEFARAYDYDVILLDLGLGDLHGYEVLRRLRRLNIATPIAILSGEDRAEAKVSGLGLGADDYITKPFQRDELVARLHALVRRSNGHAEAVIATGPISVNLSTRAVSVAQRAVRLTGKEYALLELLSLRKGMVQTKEAILNHLYGGRDEPALKIIDVFICNLRRKLEVAGNDAGACIRTDWGRGYSLCDPDPQ